MNTEARLRTPEAMDADDRLLRALIAGASRGSLEPREPNPRRRPSATPPRAAAEPPASPLLTLFVGGVILILLVLIFRPPPTPQLPREVWGTWTTTDRRYATRELTLNSRAVALRTGGADTAVSIHVIRQVTSSAVPLGTLFTVEYVQESAFSEPVTFEFIYHAAPTPEILLAHQTDIVWTREP